MTGQTLNTPTFKLPRIDRNGLLFQRLPPEIVRLIVEYAMLSKHSLTVQNEYFQQYRDKQVAEDIGNGQGSCQAQLLRTCQELYELGLKVWYQKACFRITIHCEGRHATGRTPNPLKTGKKDWLTACYGSPAGQALLAKFQHVELELIPDWGGSDHGGIVITWGSSSVIADSLRFLNPLLTDKHLLVTYARDELKCERVNLEELGMWAGMLELVRCKSASLPQFPEYIKLNQHSGPLALCKSNEEIIDLDERRNDFLQTYLDIMREHNAPEDSYYSNTLITKIKERALQCNIKEYIYLRNLYSDRIDRVTTEKRKRPDEDDEYLLRIYYKYCAPLEGLTLPEDKASSGSETEPVAIDVSGGNTTNPP